MGLLSVMTVAALTVNTAVMAEQFEVRVADPDLRVPKLARNNLDEQGQRAATPQPYGRSGFEMTGLPPGGPGPR